MLSDGKVSDIVLSASDHQTITYSPFTDSSDMKAY